LKHPRVYYFEARDLEIHSGEVTFAAESDGELIAPVPKRIVCLPSRIKFLG
jgi:diacylglycerol kinase family enzyme